MQNCDINSMIFCGLIEDLAFSTEVFCPHGTHMMIIPRETVELPPNVFLFKLEILKTRLEIFKQIPSSGVGGEGYQM